MTPRTDWKTSLHGGHSGEFCDHADGPLRDMLEAAAAFGYAAFGVSEHAPRPEERFLYDEERRRGWGVARLRDDFERYARALTALAHEFADRLTVLRGFEAEVVPAEGYAEAMRAFRDARLPGGAPAFDYFVGSVHYVGERAIDGPLGPFHRAVEACGGPEGLCVRYYETVAAMIRDLRPDVVGHLDLVKLNVTRGGFDPAVLTTPRVARAAHDALDAARAHGSILDLNTAGWRKGLGEPYPAPWLVRAAHARGVPFCFGDDSHRPADVGAGLSDARAYLLSQGVPTVTALAREGPDLSAPVTRRVVPL